jgi:hypothetical protein
MDSQPPEGRPAVPQGGDYDIFLSYAQTVRRVMVRFKVRADQAATNEQVGGCDHPGAERNQR